MVGAWVEAPEAKPPPAHRAAQGWIQLAHDAELESFSFFSFFCGEQGSSSKMI